MFTKLEILCAAITITFTLIPILLIALVPSLAWLLISFTVARTFRKDLACLFLDPTVAFSLERVFSRPKVVMMQFDICDGPVSLEELHSAFKQRITDYRDDRGAMPYDRWKQYWVQFMGYFYWKWDPDFRVENHVRMYDYTSPDCALPATYATEEDLKRVAGILLTEPFARGRSPWEILVIPNYKLERNAKETFGSVLVIRMHHAMADGYSLLGLVRRLVDFKVETPPVDFTHVSPLIRFFRGIQVLLKIPWDLATLQIGHRDASSAWNPKGTKMSHKYYAFFSKSIPVDTLKEIRISFGVSYNTVVYSIVAGAVVRMMKAAGHDVPVELTCLFPRPLPSHPGGLTNHSFLWYFKFRPHDMNAHERLKHVSTIVQPASVFHTSEHSCGLFFRLWGYLPIPVQRLCGFSLGSTFTSSNFPVSPVEVKVNPHANIVQVLACSGAVQGSTSGTVVIITSLAGHQKITMVVDRVILSKSKAELDFAAFIQEEIQQLLSHEEHEV